MRKHYLFLIACFFVFVAAISIFSIPGPQGASVFQAAHAESDCENYRQNHTKWPLTGYHLLSGCTCMACHKGGIWLGTPTTCKDCHDGTRALGKTTGHIPTNQQCETCHTTTSFATASMNHINTAGTCSTCHNGSYLSANAMKKPSGHIPTTLECDSCHTTTRNWGATWTHQGVEPGTCSTCHNGNIQTGKPSTHIPTSLECDTCHKTYGSFTDIMSHTNIHTAVTSCEACHNGVYIAQGAIGKTVTHPATPNNCANCHNITGFPCKSGLNMLDELINKVVGISPDGSCKIKLFS